MIKKIIMATIIVGCLVLTHSYEVNADNVWNFTIVQVSAYNATKKQCDSNPKLTANNTRVRRGIAAVSNKLFKEGWTFGKKIKIVTEDGDNFILEIQDRMNSRFKSRRIDIFMHHEQDAKDFGTKKAVAILLDG